jgi:hypothetical protein
MQGDDWHWGDKGGAVGLSAFTAAPTSPRTSSLFWHTPFVQKPEFARSSQGVPLGTGSYWHGLFIPQQFENWIILAKSVSPYQQSSGPDCLRVVSQHLSLVNWPPGKHSGGV